MNTTDTEIYEVVILGTGPAGLQAAIHAARAKTSVLVMGRETKSSLYRAHVENYCCLSEVSGEELLQQGIEQAKSAGADFLYEDVVQTTQTKSGFRIDTESGPSIAARSLILAMGVTRNRLGIPGEKEFVGSGVSYCVDCDASFYKGENVAVVGGESAAVSGALTLLFYANKVHLVASTLDVSEGLIESIEALDVQLHLERHAAEILGPDQVTGLRLGNGETISVSGVFIETGAKGAVELAATMGVALDSENFEIHRDR